jgi:hypothetical protein
LFTVGVIGSGKELPAAYPLRFSAITVNGKPLSPVPHLHTEQRHGKTVVLRASDLHDGRDFTVTPP